MPFIDHDRPIDPDDDAVLLAAIAAATWRDTNHVAPHQYVVRDKEPRLYAAMVARLLTRGYTGVFNRWRYHYVDLDGYTYWHIPPILNRRPIDANRALVAGQSASE